MDFENGDGLRLQSRAHDLRQASREKTESERANLIAVIRDKLVLYGMPSIFPVGSFVTHRCVSPDEILIKARDIQAFQHPSGRYYRSFRTWFWNEKPLSYEREEEFIKRRDDLITLRSGREYTVFDGMVVDTLQKIIPKTSALHVSLLRVLFFFRLQEATKYKF
jgi:hypothetical protein